MQGLILLLFGCGVLAWTISEHPTLQASLDEGPTTVSSVANTIFHTLLGHTLALSGHEPLEQTYLRSEIQKTDFSGANAHLDGVLLEVQDDDRVVGPIKDGTYGLCLDSDYTKRVCRFRWWGFCWRWRSQYNVAHLRHCNGKPSQTWAYDLTLKQLRQGKKCLDIGGTFRIAYMYPCHGGWNQKFSYNTMAKTFGIGHGCLWMFGPWDFKPGTCRWGETRNIFHLAEKIDKILDKKQPKSSCDKGEVNSFIVDQLGEFVKEDKWCNTRAAEGDFVEIRFEERSTVGAIQIQGTSDMYAGSHIFEYATDKLFKKWKLGRDPLDGGPGGAKDGLPKPINAYAIKVFPREISKGGVCVKATIYGCPDTDGDDGDDGPTGEKGKFGLPGKEGKQGDEGEPGKKGEKGLKGTRGVQGSRGVEGKKGERGAQGDLGRPGANGLKGWTGLKGDRGEKGKTGTKGEPGLPGEQGPVGLPGEDGLAGPAGDKGVKGAKGARGHPGRVAARGPVGEKGDDGDAGPDAFDGAKGEAGEVGDKGPDARDGFVGIAGPKGIAGDPGDVEDGGHEGNRKRIADLEATLLDQNDELMDLIHHIADAQRSQPLQIKADVLTEQRQDVEDTIESTAKRVAVLRAELKREYKKDGLTPPSDLEDIFNPPLPVGSDAPLEVISDPSQAGPKTAEELTAATTFSLQPKIPQNINNPHNPDTSAIIGQSKYELSGPVVPSASFLSLSLPPIPRTALILVRQALLARADTIRMKTAQRRKDSRPQHLVRHILSTQQTKVISAGVSPGP